MPNIEVKNWYYAHKDTIVKAFIEKADLFPTYRVLPPQVLHDLMEREWFGSANIMSADEEGLIEAIKQADAHFDSLDVIIPLDEQKAFLEERVKIVLNLLNTTSTSDEMRNYVMNRMKQAEAYYMTVVSSLNARVRAKRIRKKAPVS